MSMGSKWSRRELNGETERRQFSTFEHSVLKLLRLAEAGLLSKPKLQAREQPVMLVTGFPLPRMPLPSGDLPTPLPVKVQPIIQLSNQDQTDVGDHAQSLGIHHQQGDLYSTIKRPAAALGWKASRRRGLGGGEG